MADNVTYSSYLDLDRILAAQHPASDAHDELLFIIVHQASELWLKLCLHELTAARAAIEEDQLRPAFKMLARVARAQQQLIQSWDVLSTMTPHDYSAIRPHLGASSGFQSPQYRMMEFMLGGRDAKHVRLHKDNADWADRLEAERGRASLYDAAIRLLARRYRERLRRLREATRDCFHFAFQPVPGATFVGASPERFYRRVGREFETEAVAGTRTRGAMSPISVRQAISEGRSDCCAERSAPRTASMLWPSTRATFQPDALKRFT